MTAPNCKRPKWQPAEIAALEMLYRADWPWAAIAVHVSAIYGNERSANACRCRGGYLTLSAGAKKGRTVYDLDDDLEDLMLLGWSSRQIAEELGVSIAWVKKRINNHMSPQLRVSWKNRERERRSLGVARSWKYRSKARRDEMGRFCSGAAQA